MITETKKQKQPKPKFDPWATKAETLRDHGEIAPWHKSKRKRATSDANVPVTVEFADGVKCTTSTYGLTAKGAPDVDAIVRAEREMRIALACQPGGTFAHESSWLPHVVSNVEKPRATVTKLTAKDGRTYRLYLADIPAVTAAYVGLPSCKGT